MSRPETGTCVMLTVAGPVVLSGLAGCWLPEMCGWAVGEKSIRRYLWLHPGWSSK